LKYNKDVRHQWNDLLFKTIDVKGKSFIDIGTFDGETCEIARQKGAASVLGVDYIVNDHLRDSDIDVLPLDIFSEKWLYLPKFDVVSCQGVFYHVPDVISLFSRLRMITGQVMFLEGHISTKPGCFMEFRGETINTQNSNWWTPTEECLHKMLNICGFNSKTLGRDGNRIGVLCIPGNVDLRDILPRKMRNMGLTLTDDVIVGDGL